VLLNNDLDSESRDKNKKKRTNRDVVIFIFFLFVSFIFWYLNSLGKESVVGIEFPVSFINIPKERVLREDNTVNLDVHFKGSGMALLKLKVLGKRKPLIIDLSTASYKRIPEKNTLNYFITTSGLAKNIEKQVRSECEVVSVLPDTLFFTFEKSVSSSTYLELVNMYVRE
jgi:hypothetical protein